MDTDIMEIESKALSLSEKAKTIIILDQQTFKAACEFREVIKSFELEINKEYDDIIKKWNEGHKASLAKKKKSMAPVLEAKRINDDNIDQYLSEQEDIRKQEETRLTGIARKAEEEAKLAEASAYEASGDKVTANEIINEPVRSAPVVLPKANLNSGVNMRENWSAEVVSLMDLVKAVAAGKVPVQAVEANMTVLNAQARTLKDGLNWPGVKAVSKKSIY